MKKYLINNINYMLCINSVGFYTPRGDNFIMKQRKNLFFLSDFVRGV